MRHRVGSVPTDRRTIKPVRWTKGHGTENDFVVLPDADGELRLSASLVAAICDRRAGIGADGVLRVVRTKSEPDAAAWADDAEWFMDYRNADGSIAEMCGNGIRVFARYLIDAGLSEAGTLVIATRGGVRAVHAPAGGDVSVELGTADLPAALADLEVQVGERTWPAVGVLMPNPHAVAFVEDLGEAGQLLEAPGVRPEGAFPQGVNVEFVVRRDARHVAMRVHERGSGETRSCGTGAAAVMVAAARRAGDPAPTEWIVDVPGGRLRVGLAADGTVTLTGPAVLVAEGELRTDWLASL
jgi:diaminopimelate epimerase